MSTRTARALSIVIATVAIVMIVTAVPVARSARDVDRTSIVVVPGERRADIERAIEQGDGCSNPGVDQALADAITTYCELQDRTAKGELFDDGRSHGSVRDHRLPGRPPLDRDRLPDRVSPRNQPGRAGSSSSSGSGS